MRRFFSAVGAAFAGSTFGYVAYQIIDQRAQGRRPEGQHIVVGAPLLTALVAAAIGLVAGRHHRLAAFVAGAGLAGAFGDLGELIPGMGAAKQRAVDVLQDTVDKQLG